MILAAVSAFLIDRRFRAAALWSLAAARAAVAIHAAVIVLSHPGLRAEAVEGKIPVEVLEQKAVREAANDVASSYGMDRLKAADAIARLVARHAE
jgi:hypothetical protein